VVPRTRDEWTLDAITQLLIKGYKEHESFDFKESLPHKSNADKKIDLLKDCCSFANSSGGFLVFGVTDDVSAPLNDRLKGISTKEFLVDFGNFPSQCIPSIRWDFRNPPLYLDNGNAIYVIEIFRSWNVPPLF
jgi:predicted HTH transcriptional regulator